MDKKEIMDILPKLNIKLIGVFFAIFLIISGVLIIVFLKKSSRCESNPLVYGAQKIRKMGLEMSCTCSLGPKYNPLMFNADGIGQLEFNDPFSNYLPVPNTSK